MTIAPAEEFTTVWNPERDPHLEIVGMHGSGKTTAVRALASFIEAQEGSTATVAHTGIEGDRRRTPDEIEAALHDITEEMNRRYALHEENSVKRRQLRPLLVVIDEFDQPSQTKVSAQQRSRVRQQVRDLLALGRAVRIHMVLCSTAPQITTAADRCMVRTIVLGPQSHRARTVIGDETLESLPVGSGWFLRQGEGAVSITFNAAAARAVV